MRKLTLILIFLGFLTISEAQTEREKAIELKNQAIELMDNGKIDESLKLLEQAQQIDPDVLTLIMQA